MDVYPYSFYRDSVMLNLRVRMTETFFWGGNSYIIPPVHFTTSLTSEGVHPWKLRKARVK